MPATLAPGPALQAFCCHEARNPVQTGTFALLSQVFAHAGSPQRTATVLVQFAYPHRLTLSRRALHA